MGDVYNGIMGLVVGDALGVPVEFKKTDTFRITDMVGYGTHNVPAGTWSDDSSMTLATVESITRLGRIDLKDIMKNFVEWFEYAKFTAYDEVFDFGATTAKAITRYENGVPIDRCGADTEEENGNGALMRILPLVFVPYTMDEFNAVCGLTHRHMTSNIACYMYLTVAKGILKGELPVFSHVKERTRDEIKSTGYVVDTLDAALWCLYNTDNYRDCVLTAVNLGGDTDTIAAVAGGLAGLLYGVGGEKGIPEKWIRKTACYRWIEDLCDELEAVRGDFGW